MKTEKKCSFALILFLILFAVCAAAAYARQEGQEKPAPQTGGNPVRISGYLPHAALPQGLVFIPPPPEAGTAAFLADEEISQKTMKLQGTSRWRLAAEDAEINSFQILDVFSCALNLPVNPQAMPRLCQLLARSSKDVSGSARVLKHHYKRPRPFMINKKPICTPEYQTKMEGNGSYPSSHAAIGWAWALILSEIAPDKTDAILARGRAFGQSRIVCNVHWNSDVAEGRVLAAATVARLHAEPAFRLDLEAAKVEAAECRSRGLMPARQCSQEAAALAVATH